MADFNRIASLYDLLKKVVFGNQLDKASYYFLKQIPANSKILIIGGGSGKILGGFNSAHHIKYLELSDVMIRKSKLLNSKASIEFIQADILEWKTNEEFDFIITPFILDCFNLNQLNQVFPKLRNLLGTDGVWIQTDFYPKNRFHKFLIKIMYLFFNFSTNLKTKELADFDLIFEKHQFILERKALFYRSMVESKIYIKIE